MGGATDAPTQQLSDSFYDRLNQGTPDVALRKALSPCSIPTDHFARPIAGLPSDSMRDMRDYSCPFCNRAPLVLPDRVPSSVRATFWLGRPAVPA